MTTQDRPASVAKPFVAPTHSSVDILKLLTELNEIVDRAKHGPFGILIGFNDESFTNTLMKIRANLPEELKKAQIVTKESEQISDNAHQEADIVVAEARTLASNELDRCKRDSAEMKAAAEKEAERQVSEAREQARHLLTEASAKAEEMLLETVWVIHKCTAHKNKS